MKIKIASKLTVRNVPWQDQLTEIDLQADGEWIDEWLETPAAYWDASAEDGAPATPALARVKVGGTGLRRYGQALTAKQAAAAPRSSWDAEFDAAQKHAAEVLRRLG